MKKRVDLIIAIISLLIIFYILWYLFTHFPEFVTYPDLFTVWGGTLSVFGLFLTRFFNKIDRLEDKMDNLIKEFSYFKGAIGKRKFMLQ